MKQNYDSLKAIKLIISKWRLILIISLIAFVSSLIISFFIQPRFLAKAIVYPASYADSKAYFGYKDSKAWFGQLFEIDHYMQILNSEDIKDYIVSKYNMAVHYGFEPNEKYLNTKISNAYYGNLNITRTSNQAVKIEVIDPSPEFAANIVNDIVAMSDTILNKLIKERAKAEAVLLEKQYFQYLYYLQNHADSLNAIGNKTGYSQMLGQSQELIRAYSEAVLKNNAEKTRHFEKKLKELGSVSGDITMNNFILEGSSDYFGELLQNLVNAQAIALAEVNTPFKFVVDSARIPDKKDSPKKLIIVFFSTLCALFFSIFLILFFDFIEKIKARENDK